MFIPQPSHAWLSGQIGRAWGNERFDAAHPVRDVWLAAEQHDCGWALWERQPRLDPSTGLPYDFMAMPTSDHIEIWSSGPRLMASQSLYSALLVTLHNIRLAEIHDYSNDTEEDVEAMKNFIDGQKTFAEELKTRLSESKLEARFTDGELLEYNRKLVLGWDYISLLLCMGMEDGQEHEVPDVPGQYREASDTVDLTLRRIDDGTFTIEPWPFGANKLKFECDAIDLSRKCSTQQELNKVMAQAEIRRLRFDFTK